MSRKSCLYLFVMLVFSLSGVRPEEDSKYCSQPFLKLCHGKGTHVGCQFPNSGPGAPCNNYTPIKFNTAMKETVLEFINRRRQKIAAGKERARDGARIPKARVMMYVGNWTVNIEKPYVRGKPTVNGLYRPKYLGSGLGGSLVQMGIKPILPTYFYLPKPQVLIKDVVRTRRLSCGLFRSYAKASRILYGRFSTDFK